RPDLSSPPSGSRYQTRAPIAPREVWDEVGPAWRCQWIILQRRSAASDTRSEEHLQYRDGEGADARWRHRGHALACVGAAGRDPKTLWCWASAPSRSRYCRTCSLEQIAVVSLPIRCG